MVWDIAFIRSTNKSRWFSENDVYIYARSLQAPSGTRCGIDSRREMGIRFLNSRTETYDRNNSGLFRSHLQAYVFFDQSRKPIFIHRQRNLPSKTQAVTDTAYEQILAVGADACRNDYRVSGMLLTAWRGIGQTPRRRVQIDNKADCMVVKSGQSAATCGGCKTLHASSDLVFPNCEAEKRTYNAVHSGATHNSSVLNLHRIP